MAAGAAGVHLEYASGIGVEGTYANFRVSVQNLQLDDQLPFTRRGPPPGLPHWPHPAVCTTVSQKGFDMAIPGPGSHAWPHSLRGAVLQPTHA